MYTYQNISVRWYVIYGIWDDIKEEEKTKKQKQTQNKQRKWSLKLRNDVFVSQNLCNVVISRDPAWC